MKCGVRLRGGCSCLAAGLCLAISTWSGAQEKDPDIVIVDAEVVEEPATTPAKEAAGENPFLRVLRGADKQPLALETSIVRYRPANAQGGAGEVTVDLIGAIHVG